MTNEYLEEPDKQKRENTLKETIELVEKMTNLLCGEPKKNIKVLTDYGKNLKMVENMPCLRMQG